MTADIDAAAKEEQLRARSDPSVRFSIQTGVRGAFALGLLIRNAGARGLGWHQASKLGAAIELLQSCNYDDKLVVAT